MYREVFMDISSALLWLGAHHGEGALQGQWAHKGWLNVPGPLYTGDVDDSGPGPAEAPNNVAVAAASQWQPSIFRQPVNTFELRQVLLAAENDPFHAYGADGDHHWNLDAIRLWWQQRQDIEHQLAAERAAHLDTGPLDPNYLWTLARWHDYLQHGTDLYLRIYAFFLEEGRIPHERDNLPSL